ncbi:hypothetical protein HGRIS_004831 [Hohenbuehelia grisea]|uniref:Uncharacterized protein n=1 Tax=Hohenbuehelia grisea TaxID=104357 RepID=A0ABR3JD43_9AGAR
MTYLENRRLASGSNPADLGQSGEVIGYFMTNSTITSSAARPYTHSHMRHDLSEFQKVLNHERRWRWREEVTKFGGRLVL